MKWYESRHDVDYEYLKEQAQQWNAARESIWYMLEAENAPDSVMMAMRGEYGRMTGDVVAYRVWMTARNAVMNPKSGGDIAKWLRGANSTMPPSMRMQDTAASTIDLADLVDDVAHGVVTSFLEEEYKITDTGGGHLVPSKVGPIADECYLVREWVALAGYDENAGEAPAVTTIDADGVEWTEVPLDEGSPELEEPFREFEWTPGGRFAELAGRKRTIPARMAVEMMMLPHIDDDTKGFRKNSATENDIPRGVRCGVLQLHREEVAHLGWSNDAGRPPMPVAVLSEAKMRARSLSQRMTSKGKKEGRMDVWVDEKGQQVTLEDTIQGLDDLFGGYVSSPSAVKLDVIQYCEKNSVPDTTRDTLMLFGVLCAHAGSGRGVAARVAELRKVSRPTVSVALKQHVRSIWPDWANAIKG